MKKLRKFNADTTVSPYIILLISLFTVSCTSLTGNYAKPDQVFTCKKGKTVHVHYIDQESTQPSVYLQSSGVNYSLTSIPGGSEDVKYGDGIYTWWEEGKQSTLYVDGVSMIENCKIQA